MLCNDRRLIMLVFRQDTIDTIDTIDVYMIFNNRSV